MRGPNAAPAGGRARNWRSGSPGGLSASTTRTTRLSSTITGRRTRRSCMSWSDGNCSMATRSNCFSRWTIPTLSSNRGQQLFDFIGWRGQHCPTKKFVPKTTFSSSIMCRWRRSGISEVFKAPVTGRQLHADQRCREARQDGQTPRIQEARTRFSGKNFQKFGCSLPDLRISDVPAAFAQDQSHRRPSLVLRLEPVQQLLEGFFSCPTGHRHGLKIDRRLLYRVSFSGTINLPPPRVRRRCPALHGD